MVLFRGKMVAPVTVLEMAPRFDLDRTLWHLVVRRFDCYWWEKWTHCWEVKRSDEELIGFPRWEKGFDDAYS